jgi:hypothetical protein
LPSSVRDPIYRELISSLVAARIDAELTQQAVAERLARPQSYVAKVEGCERRLDVVEFLQVARAIGIDPMPMLRNAWKRTRGEMVQ